MTELHLNSPLGAPVYLVTDTTSTMDDARRAVRNGASSGTVVVTDHQSAGKGRRAGRIWHSAPRESLMFTLALWKPVRPVTRSLAMAAAVVQLLEREMRLAAEVKWPNDVLVRGRKICGILADHDAGWLYLGVGLNLLQRSFPPELEHVATSPVIEQRAPARAAGDQAPPPGAPQGEAGGAAAMVAASGWPSYRNDVLVSLLEHFIGCAESWHDVIAPRLRHRGEAVRVVSPAGDVVRGTLVGIADDGRLLVQGHGLHQVTAGEVSVYGKDDHA